MPIQNKQITLRSRPEFDIDSNLESGTFQRNTSQVNDDLEPGHALVKVEYVSIDPAMRGWLRDARSYLPPVQIGEVMRASGVGTVVKSNSKNVKEGDRVSAIVGWQQYAVLKDNSYTKLSDKGDSLDYLGVFGSSGMTAYWGLFDVAKAKEGDVIVVTGAAGSVGSIVVQLAKSIPNTTVVAVAGGDDKCAWVKETLGADIALNYKADGFAKLFRQTLKDLGYANCVFENVGGELLDLSLNCLKIGARIALCGAVSDYNTNKPAGLSNYTTLIAMRATLEGFIVFDYQKRYGEAIEKMTELMKQGKLTQQFSIAKGGLDSCPETLVGLFAGKNKGKQVVKID